MTAAATRVDPKPVNTNLAAVLNGKPIGLVLANYDYLFYKTREGKAECPTGTVHSNRENWEAQFPTATSRRQHLNRCHDMQNRGPHCENAWFNPDLVQDPLPYREVKGKVAYGVNLDGGHGGRATANTCQHEEFTTPDGTPGVDNQYYRLMGCVAALRGDLGGEQYNRRFIAAMQIQRFLIEIRRKEGSTDGRSVEVTLTRGDDPLVLDSVGKAVPSQSQRIASDLPPESTYRLRGHIINNEIVTEPADVMWENWAWENRLLIRGMSLRIKLTPSGAEVLRTGYIDVEQFWQSYAHYGQTSGGATWGTSGPSAYAAMHRLADGYKDPRTQACTALSSIRRFDFVSAHIIYPSRQAAQ